MIRIIVLIFFTLVSVNLNAQVANTASPRDVQKKIAIDKLLLQVTYWARIAVDTIKKEYYYDNQILEIGKKHNRYYSSYAEDMDSVKYKVSKGVVKAVGGSYSAKMNLNLDESGTYEDIFLNYPIQNVMTVRTKFVRKNYIYEEPVPHIKWILTNEIDTVMGYRCIKATADFRGRVYDVWFTPDLPFSYGPWKLNGLPGLILKAEDRDKLFQFSAIGISQKDGMNMYIYDEKAKKCKRKDILAMNDLRWQNVSMLFIGNGVESVTFSTLGRDGKLIRGQKPSINLKYIPQMELK